MNNQKLKSRWYTPFGQEIRRVILKNIAEEKGWLAINDILSKLDYHQDKIAFKSPKGKEYKLADLRGIDLSNQDLSNADLGYTDCSKSVFDGSLLDHAYFMPSDLESASICNVRGTDVVLMGVGFKNTKMNYSSFINSKINGVLEHLIMQNSSLSNCEFGGHTSGNLDFSGTTFENTVVNLLQHGGYYNNDGTYAFDSIESLNFKKTKFLDGSKLSFMGKWEIIYFDDSDLSNLNFSGYAIQGSHTLQNASFQRAILKNVNFGGVNLKGAIIENAHLEEANFENAVLENVSFRGANLQNANFQGANVQGADFTGANTKGANFMGAEF